jgi:hypothetical protein
LPAANPNRVKPFILRNLLAFAKARVLNQAVKRNRERFPEDFMFQLSAAEKAEVVMNCDHIIKGKNFYLEVAMVRRIARHVTMRARHSGDVSISLDAGGSYRLTELTTIH